VSYLQDSIAEPTRVTDDLLPFVASHLSSVTELINPCDRGGFLFHCWQSWAAPLAPEERVRLLGIARELGGRLSPCAPHDLAAGTVTHLRCPAPPYLLFDHVNELHLRLGVTPAVRALAAQIVRLNQNPR
jgi:hypothetical protein